MPVDCRECAALPGSEALELRAEFADFDTGSVAAEFTLRYPATSFVWLERNMEND